MVRVLVSVRVRVRVEGQRVSFFNLSVEVSHVIVECRVINHHPNLLQ